MKIPQGLKILFLDIETMPNIAAVWQTGYKLNVDAGAILQERFILSAQWSWNNDPKVHGKLSDIKKKDDSKLITVITKLIEEADIIIGHNVKKFDLRWIAGRALLNGLPPTRSKFVKT
jgi:DNA polymerase elongation subunit (family B)